MGRTPLNKRILKFVNFTFLFTFSVIIFFLSLGIFILSPDKFINTVSKHAKTIVVIITLLLTIQTISKVIEYYSIEKTRSTRRQIIVSVLLLMLSLITLVSSELIEIRKYEDLLFGSVLPIFLICSVGILTFTNIAKLFYIYPSLLFIIASGVMIIASATLLHLPISSSTGEPLPLIDTLFVATSAVSCTGLSTISVGKELSFVGQMILMITIQLGGLLIIFISTIGILFGFVSGDVIMKLRMGSFFEVRGVVETQKLILKFVLVAFTSQILVAILLLPYFLEVEKDLGKAIFYSIFHVVSALNNAGFSTYDDSLARFNNNPYFLMLIAYLILLGNTSIITVTEIAEYIRVKIKNFVNHLLHRKKTEVFRFSLFSKIVLTTHLVLILFGTTVILIFEAENLLKQAKHPLVEALFGSISLRTAGFSSFDFSQAKDPTYLFSSLLMFIGGGSISIAGGVKMNTIALFVISLFAFLRAYPSLYSFKREIDFYSLLKASAVVVGAISLLTVCVIAFYEFVKEERFSKIVFELTSAFGTVGMSSGLTSKNLSIPAKLILIFLMFSGKIGLITVLSILARKSTRYLGAFPKENLIVG
ncbi:MAG: potassium transporter TrkG [Brevinematia bacterium]